jgi:hypothetical protein
MALSLSEIINLAIYIIGIAAVTAVSIVIVWDFFEVRTARRRGVTGRDACASCGKLHAGKKGHGEWG